jgi:hypothetical protein
MNEKRVGQLFTLNYIDRGAPTADNVEFRARLASFLQVNAGDKKYALATYIAQETGYIRPLEIAPHDLFNKLPIARALTLITIVYRFFLAQDQAYGAGYKINSQKWLLFVQRTLREENLGYSIDQEGGVHYLVDDEFEHNRSAIVRGLNLPKYAGVLAAFNSAHNYLDPNALDTKAAVRSMFEALEIQTKLMVTTQNLNKYCAQNLLADVAVKALSSDPTATKVLKATFAAFGEWVDGLHNYRHGQGTAEPVSPPLELAVHVLSNGAAYLRLLLDVDQKNNAIP